MVGHSSRHWERLKGSVDQKILSKGKSGAEGFLLVLSDDESKLKCFIITDPKLLRRIHESGFKGIRCEWLIHDGDDIIV